MKTAVDAFLQFGYARHEELLPYPEGPQAALQFISSLGLLCERNCLALQDFTGEMGEVAALDLGCSTGATTFELARCFHVVVGVDQAQHFINAAKVLQKQGVLPYTAVEEGELVVTRMAQVPDDVDTSRVTFVQADPCRLPTELRKNFDAVLMSNLLDRLADPECVLNQLPDLLRPGGIAVIASPYSWSETWTPKPKWLGGRYEEGGIAVHTFEKLRQIMEHNHFELIEQRNLPYLIREHSRKYQLCLAHATVWRRHRDRPSPRSVT
eukprot:jgi/Astpho2/9905/fgenesh1_pg.00152_%23_23_t